jgi:hypothetical protein
MRLAEHAYQGYISFLLVLNLGTQKAEILAHLLEIFLLVRAAGLEGYERLLKVVLTDNYPECLGFWTKL